jgi:DNA-directed RNA polymerase beta' subunit
MKLKFLRDEDVFNPNNVITDHEPVDFQKKTFNKNGIFSETIFGKMDNEGVQWSCSCGEVRGAFFAGQICHECGTVVQDTEPTVSRIGWILLHNHKILNPIFFHFILKIIRLSVLNNIISYDKKINRDGVVIEEEESTVKNPYENLGMLDFIEQFDEILMYFYEQSKVPKKEEYLEFINNNREFIFIDKLPVFSPILRLAVMKKNNNVLIFDEINNLYGLCISNANLLKDVTDIETTKLYINPILLNIQKTFNGVFDKIVDGIKGKTGFIRNSMVGSRINFSARCVITPLKPGYKIDEISLPYLCFLELYRFQIINVLSKMEGHNLTKANTRWNEAMRFFDPMVYQVMNLLLDRTEGGVWVLLNRNPSINIGSILRLRVADIKDSYTDMTASIHNCILAPLSGDYDGDCLNIWPLVDRSLVETFNCFDPTLMIVSANDAKFNSQISLDRDQVLGINSFDAE